MTIKRRGLVAFALTVAMIATASTSSNARPKHHAQKTRTTAIPAAAVGAFCDPSLWNHVYAGDPHRFSKPKDRLQVIQDCVTVTGTIFTAKPEKDGDFHIRLKVDPQYASMLNAKNRSGQLGSLVVEPVCMNPVTQRDTIQQHACDGFAQHVYTPDMLHQHVRVVGAYVTDMEHGWNEIHPVTWISIEPR
jgi:hypothetical protein